MAIDGSKVAQKALHVAVRLAKGNGLDHLWLLHVDDPVRKAKYREANLSLEPEHLRNSAELELDQFNMRFTWVCRRKGDYSTYQILVDMANKARLDFCVFGSYGLSGLKIGNLGTTANESLRNSTVSFMAVKSTSFKLEPEGKSLMLCVSQSIASLNAFAFALQHLVNEGDRVHLFHVNTHNSDSSMVKFHEEELKKRNIHFTTTVCQDRDQNAADLICDYGERKEVDFVVLGREVKDNKLIGSISHRVVSHSKKTAVVVKYMP